ncbi:MAG: hypothetical protein II507_01320 [Treponema sp.]|nr:hypothetical protein [Treponema sp.]MBQ2463608.1 hypothetical protein [Treponema sp.]
MNDKLYRKFVLLNRIGWALVILSVVAFFGLALVCKYRQVHYNENTGGLFVKGFFSLGVLLSTGLLIGFPKTFCDVIEMVKTAKTKKSRAFAVYRLVNVGFAFLVALFLLVCSIIMFIRL